MREKGTRYIFLGLVLLLAGCGTVWTGPPVELSMPSGPYVMVLGTAQDGGFPQAGCTRDCCVDLWRDPAAQRFVACLGIVDPVSGERWMIEATPDFPDQLRILDLFAPHDDPPGILLTHAHIGHYTGLAHLGHEAMGAKRVPVWAMPRMAEYLRTNGPWSQLVEYENIELRALRDGATIALNERISVTPFAVPHREEFSEVVGFRVDGPQRSVVFLPDIDKWERWGTRIEDVIADVDVAWLDGTFHADGEIPHRAMEDIPHPFITESMERFAPLPAVERAKVRFIHLNHTNPALRPGPAREEIEAAGFAIAGQGQVEPL